jgi:metal-responsive CopG/Arc/MetJ family transcriptional regulator
MLYNWYIKEYAMTQMKTAVSIPQDLFQETDLIAHELNIPRSRVITLALEEFARRYQNKKLLEQINQAYTEPMTSDERESLEIIRSHQKRIARDEKW